MTAEGRGKNRRVEMIMSGVRPSRPSFLEVTKAESGAQVVDTVGAIPGDDSGRRRGFEEAAEAAKPPPGGTKPPPGEDDSGEKDDPAKKEDPAKKDDATEKDESAGTEQGD